jgi:hypothetical protein
VTVAAGRVAWLARWPVKSVGGEPLRGEEPAATVIAPDGRVWATDVDGLAEARADDLGFALTIRREPGHQDLPDSILLTVESSLAALGDELGGP